MRRLVRGLIVLLLTVILLAGVSSTTVYAGLYGRGLYGDCTHSSECSATTPEPTIIETKRGLEVAINLTNGQVIAPGTYTVKVTPLNGRGQSFAKAEFYVDGRLIYTAEPDATGTANWPWDTIKNRGSRIKVIVHDIDNTSVTKEFRVKISAGSMTPGTAKPATTASNPVEQTILLFEDTIRTLPTPIVQSFPYILLATLLATLLLAAAQLRREVVEMKRRRLAWLRVKQLDDEKMEFVELTSHYLRTPLAVMKGGADLLAIAKPPIDPGLMQRLRLGLDEFGKAVELLLARATENLDSQNTAQVMTIEQPKSHVWRSKLFWLPTASIAILLTFLDYIAIRADKIEMTPLTAGTQISLFVALVIGLFMVVRGRQLQERDRQRAEEQGQRQATIDEARNSLIRAGADLLSKKLMAIATITPLLPEAKAKNILIDGQNRIGEVLRRFRDTATVTPPVTSMPFASFTLNDILPQAQNALNSTLQTKHLYIKSVGNDIQLASQQPAWISQIVASLLDNAAAFSPENSQIEVSATVKNDVGTITVSDYGAGIPADKQALLFKPFTKVEGTEQFDHPGIGLSLYLDHLLITGLGGDIQVDSQAQQGTTVSLTFPVR